MLRKVIHFSAVLIVIGPYAAADGWRLLSSCPAPCAEPRDLFLFYLVGDGRAPHIYEVDPKTGSLDSSFPAPGGPGAWGITGIPLEEGVLYVANNRTSWIYKITTTGSVLSSFLCPLPGPAGIYCAGASRLEITIPDMNVIAAINPTEGYLLSAFRGPGLRPTSCAYEKWGFVGDAGTHTIYASREYPIITGIETPSGLFCYEYIQDNGASGGLYVVDAATKYIYNYEDDAAVVPASLGRVKALFR
jgi:hypothetical protein